MCRPDGLVAAASSRRGLQTIGAAIAPSMKLYVTLSMSDDIHAVLEELSITVICVVQLL